MPEEIKPVEPIVTSPTTELPKTKDDWARLAKDDPQKWMDLTQSRMDQVVRESRETKEKLTAAEQEKKNLLAEVEKLKQPVQPPQQPVAPLPEDEKYGRGKYPQSEEEWNDLFLERPTFANDLRNVYLNDVQTAQNYYVEERTKAAKTLVQEHADMYVAELEADGTIKKDSQGKPVLKIDPGTNWPIFNPNSEKGKLWNEVWEEEERSAKFGNRPNAFTISGKGPLLMMAEMERRLRMKGATMVNQGQNNSTDSNEGAIAPRGVTPPSSTPMNLSESEKNEANLAVSRGTYKSVEEWYKWRTAPTGGYAEKNSRPDFTKR